MSNYTRRPWMRFPATAGELRCLDDCEIPAACTVCGREGMRTDTQFGVRHDCRACGTSSWGYKPMVTQEVRNARLVAHEAFDALWKPRAGGRRLMKRPAAYAWLAAQMGLTPAECHFALFDVEQCDRAITLSDRKMEALERRSAS